MSLPKAVMFLATFVFCCMLSAATSRRHVEKMQIVVETEDDVEYAESSRLVYSFPELFRYKSTDLKSTQLNTLPQLGSFKWQNCGSSSDLLVINSLTVTPDPLQAPGAVVLTFDISIQQTFTAPLKLALDLQKYEGFFWLHIPCIDGKGSCTYDDLCPTLAGFTCPAPFIANKIPCKCPFTAGHYSLPSSTFSVPVSIPSGQYHAKAQTTYGSRAVNCVEVWFNVA